MANVFSIACPSDCSTVFLPAIEDDQNCAPLPKRSQICGLIFAQGVLPTDWTDPTTYNILNDVSAIDAAKYVVGSGGLGDPDEEVVEGPKDQDVVANRTYTLEFNVFNLSDAHYDFLRTLQCGNTDFVFWFESIAGYMYGGAAGICPKSVTARLPKENSRTAYDSGNITITFEALNDPDRSAWTGFDDDALATPTVLAYGPVSGGTEVYSSDATSDYYAPTT